MWLGALLLSLTVVPFGTGIVLENAQRLGRDNRSFTIFPLFVLCTALVYWCDISLVTEGLKVKKRPWASGRLDWVVWLAATVLSTWCVWQTVDTVQAYRRLGGLGLDLILTTAGLDGLMLFFDLAIIALIIKTRVNNSAALP